MVHAHAYFPYSTEAEQQAANSFRQQLINEYASNDSINIGGIARKPVGPHPLPQFEIAFTTPGLAEVVPWLMFNRPEAFSVLVHPFTEKLVEDHTCRAVWLGKQLPMSLTSLAKFQEQITSDLAAGKDHAAVMWKFMDPNPAGAAAILADP